MRHFYWICIAAALSSGQARPAGDDFFQDRRQQAGITFALENSPTEERYLIETMAGGVAFLDYDQDGKLDLFFVNGAELSTEAGRGSRIDKSNPRYWNRLYRNAGNGKFEDVTRQAGVQGRGFGLGVAVGDYDNDGYPDLYVTNFGGNELYRNEGDGTFRDVTRKAGVAAGGFSASAGFFDYDRDGYLDLYVTRYVDWSFENNLFCGVADARDYCHPSHFRGVPDLLFRNNHDGTFADVSARAGVNLPEGKGLGVAFADFDSDGWPDVYVANDSVPSFLLRNDQGKFEEVGLVAAAAVNEHGETFAGMGVDFSDYDNDGRPDIFVTALSLEGAVLFRNNGDSTFSDVSMLSGVRRASFYLSGWGVKIFDYDNDGRKDLFVANGHVMRNVENVLRTVSYSQPLMMLRQEGSGFRNGTETMGPAFHANWPARGAAFGDYDNDGDVDIAVQVLGDKPLLLENLQGNRNHWIGIDLRGHQSNRDALGATVKVTGKDGVLQYLNVQRAGSYLSSNDRRAVAGLGSGEVAVVEILWPSGSRQTVPNPAIGQYLMVEEPRPKPESDP